MGFGGNRTVWRCRQGGDFRPPGELASFFEGEIKEGSEHLSGKLDGHSIYPVERFLPWQFIKNGSDSRSNDSFELSEIGGCHCWADYLSSPAMIRGVHTNKVDPLQFFL